jgi:uncharacterized coiled-coil protein SlyX
MKYEGTHHDTRLELRVLELEDTVAALTGVVQTMSEMLGALNQIVEHYADNFTNLAQALPGIPRRIPLWPVPAVGVVGAKSTDTSGDTR